MSRSKPRISARKQPQQTRSTRLVDDILTAAVQVLRAEGVARFTTARVAERAGVSVGSLYQYFPNKKAILFRLQIDEWRETGDLLRGILQDRDRAPLDRLRSAVHGFFHSECAERDLRDALDDAAPLFRDAPEARRFRREAMRLWLDFWREALPDVPRSERTRATDLVAMTLEALGKRVSETGRRIEVAAVADRTTDMIIAYLDRVRATA